MRATRCKLHLVPTVLRFGLQFFNPLADVLKSASEMLSLFFRDRGSPEVIGMRLVPGVAVETRWV